MSKDSLKLFYISSKMNLLMFIISVVLEQMWNGDREIWV